MQVAFRQMGENEDLNGQRPGGLFIFSRFLRTVPSVDKIQGIRAVGIELKFH